MGVEEWSQVELQTPDIIQSDDKDSSKTKMDTF